ncbi:MAG: hypothetical protein L0Z51_01655, partial [Candidatus Latescibacteria bacterium]|nr:hypothetical protein [Candidatus Latescibacterota bacterium]
MESRPDRPASIDAESITPILTEIAGIASETLELPAILGRIAVALRELIPFDNIAFLAHLRLRRFESRQKRIIHSI